MDRPHPLRTTAAETLDAIIHASRNAPGDNAEHRERDDAYIAGLVRALDDTPDPMANLCSGGRPKTPLTAAPAPDPRQRRRPMTLVLPDHEILRRREPHWREQGWTARDIAEAREYTLRGTEPPCMQSPGDVWELVHEMTTHLDTRRTARHESAELDPADDLEVAP